MKIYIQKINPEAKLSNLAYLEDADIDLFSVEDIDIPSVENRIVRTGIKIAIPEGYAGFAWDKVLLGISPDWL